MIEKDALEQAFRDAFALFPVAMYLGICCAVACRLDGIGEWFSTLFDFEGLETVGDYLLQLGLILLGISLTPGALVYFLVRGILRINISHIRKDDEE